MPAPPVLLLQDIRLTFGGTPVFEGAELSVGPSERVCLVGRNGSGKSTLMKIAAGLIQADSGRRFVQPGTTVRYLPQEPDFAGFATVMDYVARGLGPTDDPHQARTALEALGLTGEEDPRRLSGGEARRAALAEVLAPDPDVLLLDEPTNHLDLLAIEWLEDTLKSRRKALVLISHDRRFLESLSDATVWIDRSVTRRMDRGFAAFEDWRDQVFAEEERERYRLDKKISAETDWLHKGVTARRKRNMGRLRALHTLRQERREQRGRTGTVAMAASEAGRSGKLVTEAEGITKRFGERTIVDRFSTIVQRGDRVGFVGPNGAGKTTLLALLLGRLEPDEGTVRLGTNLEVASLDQKRADLDLDESLKASITRGASDTIVVSGQPKHFAGYMKDFLFSPEQAGTPVGALSGGERARLALARAFAQPSNVLVLDEPTNDLDLETLDLLAELVADYPGTVMLVSHDRDFLDRTVTSVIAAEGNGRWVEYAGGYSDMVGQRGAGVEPRADPTTAAKPKPADARAPERPTPAPAAARRRKLSFREQHDLETLPAEIERLGREIGTLEARLADPALYTKDPAGFQKATTALGAAQQKRSAAEERWLELEILREELEAS